MQTISPKRTPKAARPYILPAKTVNWSTPDYVFARLNKVFRFTLDAAASAENAKCELYFDLKDDGLIQDWGRHRVFLNPPYGRCIGAWARKALEASKKGATVVMLVPARTDTAWFHDVAMHRDAKVWFVRGRLKFGGSKNAAPFGNIVVVLRPPLAGKRRRKAGGLKAA